MKLQVLRTSKDKALEGLQSCSEVCNPGLWNLDSRYNLESTGYFLLIGSFVLIVFICFDWLLTVSALEWVSWQDIENCFDSRAIW